MDARSNPVSPVPEEENLFGKTEPEVANFDAGMILKTDRKSSPRFVDKDKMEVSENRFDDQGIAEGQGQSDSRLSNGIYYRENCTEEIKKFKIGKTDSELEDSTTSECGGKVATNQKQLSEENLKSEREAERYDRIDEDVDFVEGDESSEIKNRLLNSPGENYGDDGDDNKMETVDNMPLDLSVKSEIRDTYLMDRRMTSPASPGCRDSCTDSEDSDGPGGKTHGGKAYKKSLMKRYCKCF